MNGTQEYQVGDCVRLTCDLPVAASGTAGVVKTLVRDQRQQITALTILITEDSAHTCGTTVFPHEVELVERARACSADGN